MVVRRQPLLVLLLCLATLTVSVAGKKCRDRKTAKGCVKKREKNFCQEESSCPKPKKGGKKCKKTRKACRQTCGLCTPGVDPLTNQPINENYVAPVNTALTSMMTACSCTPTTAGSSGPQQTGDDPNSGTAPVYATVGGWDMTSGMAPPYFCVKTEYKGVDSEIAINICSAGTGALNAASCPSGMQACGRTGYPSPPPSPPPPPPPPPPSPPSRPPPSSPPSSPPSPKPPPSNCVDIADRAKLIDALNDWCAADNTRGDGTPDPANTKKKDPLTRCAPSTWNVQSVTDMTNVIGASNCDVAEWGKLTNGVSHDDINAWDVSGVTKMESLFNGAAEFNLPLNGWNVAKVTNMLEMFKGAAKFNQPLSSWNVAKATTMSYMFDGAAKFNQPLNSWNVAKVTTMVGTFRNAGLFSQEIGSWNTAEVTLMSDMFSGAAKFKQNLNDWDVGKVTKTDGMFMGAALFNAPLNAWNVAKLADANKMFMDAAAFNAPLNAWNVAKLTVANKMFENAAAFNQGLGAWDVGTNNFANVAGVSADYGLLDSTTITDMFKGTTAMSDCNKKAIHNKFEAAPRSLNFDFDIATNAVIADRSDWNFPGLTC